jgi:hypothetical protein
MTGLTRTICCKLDVVGHAEALAVTQHAFNGAAAWIARVCWGEGATNQTTAHHRAYGESPAVFGLGAQLAVRARMKAIEAIKAVNAKHRDTCPQCGPRGGVRRDARTYRLMTLERVSLNMRESRIVCRLVLGFRQRSMLHDPDWEVDGAALVWHAGVYHPRIAQSRKAPAEHEPDGGTLGVDLGIVSLATDGEGEHFTGTIVHIARTRYRLQRQRMRPVDAGNAKRRLPKRSRRAARFQSEVNQGIGKKLVAKAAVAGKAIALEDLSAIRERTTARRAHRYERRSWAFFQLRQCIACKAAQVDALVFLGSIRNTSRTCSVCGHSEKANRTSHVCSSVGDVALR